MKLGIQAIYQRYFKLYVNTRLHGSYFKAVFLPHKIANIGQNSAFWPFSQKVLTVTMKLGFRAYQRCFRAYVYHDSRGPYIRAFFLTRKGSKYVKIHVFGQFSQKHFTVWSSNLVYRHLRGTLRCMYLMAPRSHSFGPFFSLKMAEMGQNSGVVLYFLKNILVCDQETWFTGVSEEL